MDKQKIFVVESVACAMVFMLVSLFLSLTLSVGPSDDAYIHLCIAKNFAQYGLPYFDIQHPVYSTSTTVWTCIVTLLYALPFSIEHSLAFFCSSLLGLVAGLSFYIVRVHAKLASIGACLCALAIWSACLWSGLDYMETPLAIVLALCTLLLFQNSQFKLAYVIAAIIPFVRLEYSLIPILLASIRLYQTRGSALKEIFTYSLAGATPWLLFALYFYGSIIPQTVITKSKVYHIEFAQFPVMALGGLFGSEILLKAKFIAALYIIAGLTLLLIALFRPCAVKPLDKATQNIGITCALLSILILTAYALSAGLIATWYTPLYIVPLLLSISFGIPALGITHFFRYVFLVFFCLPLFAQSAQYIKAALQNKPELAPEYLVSARVKSFISIAEELNNQNSTAVLLAPEIGALGFAFKGTLLDAVGLVTPEAVAYHPLTIPEERVSGAHGSVPPRYVEKSLPDYIVGLDLFLSGFTKHTISKSYLCEKRAISTGKTLDPSNKEELWGSHAILLCRKL